MAKDRRTEFEIICEELSDATRAGYALGESGNWERAFRQIARMAQAEEGCSAAQARRAVAAWWRNAKTMLSHKDIHHLCLAAFPLHALKVAYLNRKTSQSVSIESTIHLAENLPFSR